MASTIGNEPGFWDYAAGALGPGYGPSETRSRFKRNQLQDALVNQFMEEQKAKQEYLAAKAGGPTGLAMQDIDALNQETMTAPRFDGKRITAGTVGRVGIPDELRDNAPLEDTNIAGMKAKLQANPNQYSGNEALAPVQADQLREQIASAPRRFATAQNERLTRAMPDEMIAADVARMTPKMQVVGKNIVRLDGDKATEIYKGGAEGTWQQVVDGDQAFKVRVDDAGNEISKRIPLGMSADARQLKGFEAIAARGEKPPKPPANMMVRPGTSPEDQDWVPVPGSPLAIQNEKQQRKKERQNVDDQKLLNGALGQLKETEDLIDSISNDPQLDTVTGRFAGRLKDDSMVWGEDQANVIANITTLKARNFLAGLSQLKQSSPSGSSGLGSLTETEGQKVQAALGTLDRAVGPTNYRKALANLKNVLARSRQAFQDTYNSLHEDDDVIDLKDLAPGK